MAKKILVVEDDKSLSEALSAALKRAKYDVIVEGDGAKAADVIKKETPDLIFLDIMLPGATGWEILESLKDEPVLDSSKIIALTNLDSSERRLGLMNAGVTEYLVKADTSLEELLKIAKEKLGE